MLLIDILQNPTKYQNDGGFSIPKILKELFNKLGATYVKLGQFIASSPTLFPAEFVLEFQSCLDRGPSVPYADIKKIIESDLQKPVSAVFKSIDPVPLACASIAQVHRAVLTNGTEVVVKVRKPNVEESLKADLGFLYVGSKLLELINPDLSRLSLAAIIGDLRDSMLDELDFTKEAQNLIEFREFLRISGVVDATAPMPYVGVSSKKVLVMEYLKGVPLVDLEGIKKYSANPELTLLSALRTWALSVTNSDFYHADVHAGNLLVLEDGRVGFIDFGIVGRISDTVWQSLGQLTEAFVAEDYRGIATALVAMGATDATVDIDKFAGDLKGVVEKIMNINPQIILESYDNGNTLSSRLVLDECSDDVALCRRRPDGCEDQC
jgi:aarF domain-containing kinase